MTQSIVLSNGDIVKVPEGADPADFRKYAEALALRRANPQTGKRRSYAGRRPSRRSQYARMQSVIGLAMLELVERVNGKEAAGDSWYTIKAGDYTARVDRETGRITYEDNE